VSNGNAAAGILLTAAILTGMSQAHGGPGRRHATARHWSSPERVELGDSHIPVRSIRSRTYGGGDPGRPRIVHHEVHGKSAVEESPEVIVGYVDPSRGPAAFHRLTRVVEGDRVKVVRHDHTVDWFRVDSVRRLVKHPVTRQRTGETTRPPEAVRPPDAALPPDRSAGGRPELRLISIRPKAKYHGDVPPNVVVSAHLDRPG
jgi:hypothetical protein